MISRTTWVSLVLPLATRWRIHAKFDADARDHASGWRPDACSHSFPCSPPLSCRPSVFAPRRRPLEVPPLAAIGRQDGAILRHGPPPAFARGRGAVGGAEPWPQVHPGVVRGARAAAGL